MVVEPCKRGFCELQNQIYLTLQLLYTDTPAGTKMATVISFTNNTLRLK